MGEGLALFRGDSCRGTVRLCRAVRQAGFHNIDSVRWVLISTRSSSTSYVTGRAPSISFPDDDANQSGPKQAAKHLVHFTLAEHGIPARRVPLPVRRGQRSQLLSPSSAEMRVSSSLFWRPHRHEVPRDLYQDCSGSTQPLSRSGAGLGPRGRLDQPLSGTYMSGDLANKSLYSYAHSPFCTSCAGGRAFDHTGDISEAESCAIQPCSTTSCFQSSK